MWFFSNYRTARDGKAETRYAVAARGIDRIYFFAERAPLRKRTDTAEVSAMRVNIWLILSPSSG
jgi:hypothetical protein